MKIANLEFVFDRRGRSSETKEGVVDLKITANRERKYISTGVKLLPKEWSNGSVVNRKDWKELNEQLHVFKKKVSEIVTQMMEEGSLDLNAIPIMLDESMKAQGTFIEYAKEMAQRRYAKITTGTRRHYDVLFNFLDSWGKIKLFSDITERNILKMDEELTARGLKECTRWNYHKLVKSFVLQALEDGLIKRNPYSHLDIKRGNENGLKRFLTPDEFYRLKNCIIPSKSLQRVRDLFVFQTYTMMSYSDLASFDYKNCEKSGGQVIYKSKRQKTKQEFTIVLLKPALDILKRYGNKLPIISNVKYNMYLKGVVTYAKITKEVTTHWARHTGATILLNDGVPMQIIQHILGHASIRETERTYAKLMDDTIIRTMKDYQKKFAK